MRNKQLYTQLIIAYFASMETDSLYLFAEVMRQRSFTQVAKQRGIASSSVSRAINALEAEVGTRLFQRTTRQIVPTEAGLIYFERIGLALEELETAKLLATELSNQPQGTLKITLPKVFGEMHIVPLLAEFTRQYPDLSLEIRLNDRYIDLLAERVDVAVRVGTLQDSSHIARRLKGMRFYITASPEYFTRNKIPTSPEQIKEHNCLIFPRNGQYLNWIFKRKQKTQEIPVKGKYLLTQSSAIKQCAMAGMGLSLLPDWLIQRELDQGQLVRVLSEFQVTTTDYLGAVWLVYPSKEFLPVKVRLFCDFLLERLGYTRDTSKCGFQQV